MSKTNCWEFMDCGKEPGGYKANTDGICPIASSASKDGRHNGTSGGRLCWVIADTLNYAVICSEHHHKSSCFSCEFRYKVTTEEGLIKLCHNTGSLIQSLQKASV